MINVLSNEVFGDPYKILTTFREDYDPDISNFNLKMFLPRQNLKIIEREILSVPLKPIKIEQLPTDIESLIETLKFIYRELGKEISISTENIIDTTVNLINLSFSSAGIQDVKGYLMTLVDNALKSYFENEPIVNRKIQFANELLENLMDPMRKLSGIKDPVLSRILVSAAFTGLNLKFGDSELEKKLENIFDTIRSNSLMFNIINNSSTQAAYTDVLGLNSISRFTKENIENVRKKFEEAISISIENETEESMLKSENEIIKDRLTFTEILDNLQDVDKSFKMEDTDGDEIDIFEADPDFESLLNEKLETVQSENIPVFHDAVQKEEEDDFIDVRGTPIKRGSLKLTRKKFEHKNIKDIF